MNKRKYKFVKKSWEKYFSAMEQLNNEAMVVHLQFKEKIKYN
jgi:hypothetical protein